MVVEDPLRSTDDDTSEVKAARLAPPEEQMAQHTTDMGALRINTGNLNLPKQFVGAETEPSRIFRPHRIVVVLLGLVLAFIVFIAYLVSRTPEPENYSRVKIVRDGE